MIDARWWMVDAGCWMLGGRRKRELAGRIEVIHIEGGGEGIIIVVDLI